MEVGREGGGIRGMDGSEGVRAGRNRGSERARAEEEGKERAGWEGGELGGEGARECGRGGGGGRLGGRSQRKEAEGFKERRRRLAARALCPPRSARPAGKRIRCAEPRGEGSDRPIEEGKLAGTGPDHERRAALRTAGRDPRAGAERPAGRRALVEAEERRSAHGSRRPFRHGVGRRRRKRSVHVALLIPTHADIGGSVPGPEVIPVIAVKDGDEHVGPLPGRGSQLRRLSRRFKSGDDWAVAASQRGSRRASPNHRVLHYHQALPCRSRLSPSRALLGVHRQTTREYRIHSKRQAKDLAKIHGPPWRAIGVPTARLQASHRHKNSLAL